MSTKSFLFWQTEHNGADEFCGFCSSLYGLMFLPKLVGKAKHYRINGKVPIFVNCQQKVMFGNCYITTNAILQLNADSTRTVLRTQALFMFLPFRSEKRLVSVFPCKNCRQWQTSELLGMWSGLTSFNSILTLRTQNVTARPHRQRDAAGHVMQWLGNHCYQ